jgi:hypothetical protein
MATLVQTIEYAIADGTHLIFKYPQNKHAGWQPVTVAPIEIRDGYLIANVLEGINLGKQGFNLAVIGNVTLSDPGDWR